MVDCVETAERGIEEGTVGVEDLRREIINSLIIDYRFVDCRKPGVCISSKPHQLTNVQLLTTLPRFSDILTVHTLNLRWAKNCILYFNCDVLNSVFVHFDPNFSKSL